MPLIWINAIEGRSKERSAASTLQPFNARPRDDLGFAVGRTHVNSKVAQGEELQNANGLGPVAVQDSEYPVELYYSINVTNWMTFRPNIQYVYHSGGTSENANVVVLALKASVKF
jgi:porin